jgi:hypothetical protein
MVPLRDARVLSTILPDAALGYAAQGWLVFPCKPSGKEPLTPRGLKDATTDHEQVNAWWATWPTANIGVRTGPESGLLVVDIDADHHGFEGLAKLEASHDRGLATLESATGGGGSHLLFRYPHNAEIRNSAGKLAYGVDIRGAGGYIIVPPSGHKSGRRYRWCDWHAQPLDPPGWLLDALTKPAAPPARVRPKRPPLPFRPKPVGYWEKAADAELAKLARTPEGQCHDELTRSAFRLGQLAHLGMTGAEQTTIIDALADAALTNAREPRNRPAAHKTAAECFDAGKASPREPERRR